MSTCQRTKGCNVMSRTDRPYQWHLNVSDKCWDVIEMATGKVVESFDLGKSVEAQRATWDRNERTYRENGITFTEVPAMKRQQREVR